MRHSLLDNNNTAYKGLVAGLDVESTITSVEGLDVIAQKRSEEIRTRIAQITADGMSGKCTFHESINERFRLLHPTFGGIQALSQVYIEGKQPGIDRLLEYLKKSFRRIIYISGGLRQAIEPFTKSLEIPPENLFAINLTPDCKLPTEHVLFEQDGKKKILREIIEEEYRRLSHNHTPLINIMIGDGMTDAAAKDEDVFFIAVGNRKLILDIADFKVKSLEEIPHLLEKLFGESQKKYALTNAPQ